MLKDKQKDTSFEGKVALVTGAAGGVGSVALAILGKLGYSVAAVTGRPETEGYLKSLGASRIVPRGEIAEAPTRPLDKEFWAGAIDNVGGSMLARVLTQMKYGGSVAAVGLAGGNSLPTTVLPFILLSLWFDPDAGRWIDPAAWAAVPLVAWLSLAYLGWAATVLGYGMWTSLLKRSPANRVAPFSLGVPLVGMAAGLWVLDEVVTAWQWAGVACVVLALVCVVLGARLGMK